MNSQTRLDWISEWRSHKNWKKHDHIFSFESEKNTFLGSDYFYYITSFCETREKNYSNLIFSLLLTHFCYHTIGSNVHLDIGVVENRDAQLKSHGGTHKFWQYLMFCFSLFKWCIYQENKLKLQNVISGPYVVHA